MERKWYKKEGEKWAEAPATLETEKGYISNYNTDANEVMLREHGYLPENEIEI